jgi:hypothetical protein
VADIVLASFTRPPGLTLTDVTQLRNQLSVRATLKAGVFITAAGAKGRARAAIHLTRLPTIPRRAVTGTIHRQHAPSHACCTLVMIRPRTMNTMPKALPIVDLTERPSPPMCAPTLPLLIQLRMLHTFQALILHTADAQLPAVVGECATVWSAVPRLTRADPRDVERGI